VVDARLEAPAGAARAGEPAPPALPAYGVLGPPAPKPPPAHCVGVPSLGPDGAPPPAPPHLPLGQEVEVPGDRPLYLLPGNDGDTRLIVYLHGMCGDVAAADYFREAVRAHGSLLALRGDTHCAGDRFKWRDDSATILERIKSGLKRVNDVNGTALTLQGALLFGYSQGADRAEKLAARFPQIFPRVVLGGPPVPPSPLKLAHLRRVAVLGGELETTENMRLGAEAVRASGITCRFFTLDCAYHGYYGTHAEQQLLEVLVWVSAR
jgi:predicted esterase